ncbi:cobalt transporter ATP-binding subunit [Companilactobacillus paralimentarius DSM 13238 = JCM 10415]|uniref:Cobalt transporter ATP-binding subunit n=1 Tax=Companilactobacillus paralimentarius DSM 13238 = JCM 10415 TaxID=1122151 RepID=A0A0R1PHT3_9LACO|nr:energy-coupling factor transporter ATPase [Companilactobacillus paralimentarius]KAE9561131.1 energy-coupling factor transporter ATPase [Companilactobacillus paralimentarius]KRL29541.1 cobalt transporter ATP-binding subunit [Companilactobacillus paralimentarius DSM 13238 = JCM 10415]MDR4933276.1 energy-coupling factor transporter ATPase [Companilactobacillus paralimentarius]QFR69780.1 energy-coupling factor transporter ATPase [Companilactobacillus paralimentarius]
MEKIISIKNLNYTYPDSKKPAINNLTVDIYKNEWLSIVGKNGSGKSTLTKLIDGLIDADSGTIEIDGQEINEKNIWEVRTKIGIVFQNPDHQFVGATVEDDVAFGLENQGMPREQMVKEVDHALELVGMHKFKKRDPQTLSGGQKQRVAIAGVLATRPQIIIMDESTSMLDPEGRRTVLNLIQELRQQQDLTIISITHDISETELSQRIVVLNDGQIVRDDIPRNIYDMGTDLSKYGLEEPFSDELMSTLRNSVELPESYLNEEELMKRLWKLRSNM